MRRSYAAAFRRFSSRIACRTFVRDATRSMNWRNAVRDEALDGAGARVVLVAEELAQPAKPMAAPEAARPDIKERRDREDMTDPAAVQI